MIDLIRSRRSSGVDHTACPFRPHRHKGFHCGRLVEAMGDRRDTDPQHVTERNEERIERHASGWHCPRSEALVHRKTGLIHRIPPKILLFDYSAYRSSRIALTSRRKSSEPSISR